MFLNIQTLSVPYYGKTHNENHKKTKQTVHLKYLCDAPFENESKGSL